MRARLLLVVAVLLVVVPAGVLVWVRLGVEDRLSGLHVVPEPVEMVVGFREDVGRRSVNVWVEWGVAEVVVAPQWFGLVTGVGVGVGDVVSDGEVVGWVDGVARVAVVSEAPFHRFLGLGARGADVVMLEGVLVRFGLLDEARGDGVFDRAMLAAVRGWAEVLGVPGQVSGFDPGWVVWLQADGLLIGEVGLVAGRPAPPPGEPVVWGQRRIVEVSLLGTDGSVPVLEGAWVLEVGSVMVDVVDGVVDEAGLVVLSGSLDPQTDVLTGTVRRVEGRLVMDVPAAAVVAGPDGGLCVYRQTGAGWEPVPVVVGAGRAGTVEVVSGLGDGDVVLANPGDVLDAAACR